MVYKGIVTILMIIRTLTTINAQDYDVSDIRCTTSNNMGGTKSGSLLVAKLQKPEGFKGHPLFADDRNIDPETDTFCQIKQDSSDPAGLKYNLKINDFSRCGIFKTNNHFQVRVWFPQFPGVVMQNDQELLIMCQPPESTRIESKAAGFAGSFPHGARVSGIVEESPGKLEYEVALYKEAPTSRINNISNNNELPVDQAVPIGTKLQLRARINSDSAWKYVKLMEVTVSPDADDPHMHGSISLVKDGCRNRDFAAIIPHQPARYRDYHNEVFLDFEAFLLSTMNERSTLWIHSQIKACMEPIDCQPDFCLDLFEPSGHGRRRKRREIDDHSHQNGSVHFAKIQGNLEYTVLMPGEFFHKQAYMESSCSTFLVIATILGCLLFMAAFLMCWLTSKLHSALLGANDQGKNVEDLVRDNRLYSDNCYTGRPVTQ